MQNVTIVGAGMAGLTAALRLAERGYKVTLFERDSFVGGKFRATEWKGKATGRSAFHEHSYHMFLNWYHNFWKIAHEIGAFNDFIPKTNVKFLRAGKFPKMKELENFGALSAVAQNLKSGVLSVPDMFLYMYSVVDMLGTRIDDESHYRNLISVNGFASTRPYATEASVSMYDEYLAKTFAVASYESSVKTFQTFLEYGAYCPEPLYWALKGDSYTHFLRKLLLRLERRGVEIYFNHNAARVEFDAHGRASKLHFTKYGTQFSPSLSEKSVRRYWLETKSTEQHEHALDGPLILAVPPAALANLLKPDFLNRDPDLGETDKLRSIPMASAHVHFNDGFKQRLSRLDTKLPPEPVVLLDSKFKLSFVANSSLWRESEDIYLNVVASDSRPLNTFNGPNVFMADREHDKAARAPKPSDLSIDAPKTTLDYMLNEFRRFVPFEKEDLELDLLQLDRNVGRELFINDVGSWQWRPQTRTKVPNVFLAGDYCKHFIDVVSLEGAVVSGLLAAQAVCRYTGVGAPIEIKRPKTYPNQFYWPWRVALAPYAAAAKLWTVFDDFMRRKTLQ
jgi:zeta-carotene desaturase